mgnify:CR=1 FL=1
MEKPLIWIIDEEWPDYELVMQLLKTQYPDCDIRFSTFDYAADLDAFGENADAVICQVYAPMPAATIQRLKKCKIIAVYGGGYDRVDIAAAKEKGIYVTNVSGYCAEDLSDYVMAAIFAANKHFLVAEEALDAGKWGANAVGDKGIRLRESTLLIVGCGTIGSLVAKKAQVHQMHVIAYAQLRLLKPSAFLVNTARGKVFVEDDLIRAKREGLFRGAMLDVISAEPPTYQEEIFDCDGLYVTPHISYISVDSFEELKRRACGNAITALEGGVPRDWVNP